LAHEVSYTCAPWGLKSWPSTRNEPAVALLAVTFTVKIEPATSDAGDVEAPSVKVGDVGLLAVGIGIGAPVTTSNGATTVVAVVDVGSPVVAEIE
jgi:hypothetical protein